jgi:hypothetical protein
LIDDPKSPYNTMDDFCCANDTSTPSPLKIETRPDQSEGEEPKIEENAEKVKSDGSKLEDVEEKKQVSTPKKVMDAMKGVVVPKVII